MKKSEILKIKVCGGDYEIGRVLSLESWNQYYVVERVNCDSICKREWF